MVKSVLSVSPSALYNYAKYKLSAREPKLNFLSYRPILCALLVTRRCNLSCPFCIVPPLSQPEEWRPYEADRGKVERILDHPAVRRAPFIGLSGGEPLLNEELGAIIRLIRQRGHLCGVVTNGILLMNRIRELKRNDINIINISVYDANIKKLAAELAAINNVFRCRTNKILFSSEVEKNPEKLEEIIRMSRDTGCHGVYFGNNLSFDTEGPDEIIYDDNESYREFRIRMTEKYRGFPIYWAAPVKRILSRQDKKCRMLWYYLSTDMMGNLGLCCGYSTDKQGAYGNLFAKDDTGSWNSVLKVNMRKIILADSAEVPGKCRKCSIMCDKWVSDY
ncbi:MAG: radical SAM protein [Candidatus Omnitrophota bacterium]